MPDVPRSQLAAYAVIAVAILVLGARWLAREEAPAAVAAPVVEAPRERAPAGGGGSGTLVHVAGAVARPGVYRLPGGARVRDAVARAGGATARGDANGINLAAPVQDGVQVVVPHRGAAAAAGATAADAPVNLNSATAEQLETLDGVGPATSAKILEYREQHGGFRTVDDLGQVSGIGPKTLEALRDKVAV